MFSYTYQTKGTCSRAIEVVLDGKTIQSVSFAGGCPGNLSGISKMVEGMDIDFVIGKLAGTRCGNRPTSCPDQLTIALREAYAAQEGK
ncbi:MAG: TIGR03905 family TSCPD domain-containing protein [Schwartzia sp.]|nr:TIGR03905 family TSCPD domain-containing protein [Schwartzia sp. (in: firmicutes)]MBR1760828.1 TIGR03905 family TSCPD domain-containing protein [Schwartzia sp. (in: firmicutes)]